MTRSVEALVGVVAAVVLFGVAVILSLYVGVWIWALVALVLGAFLVVSRRNAARAAHTK